MIFPEILMFQAKAFFFDAQIKRSQEVGFRLGLLKPGIEEKLYAEEEGRFLDALFKLQPQI